MITINTPTYKCETCGEILEFKDEVYNCKDCDKEICVMCAGFNKEYCWKCNENHLED